MAKCNDPTDRYANVIYGRSTAVILSTGPFPIENLSSMMVDIRHSFGVFYVETSGPNGESVYTGSSYPQFQAAGGVLPAPTVGSIDDSGSKWCAGPIPCPTGQHWDLTL